MNINYKKKYNKLCAKIKIIRDDMQRILNTKPFGSSYDARRNSGIDEILKTFIPKLTELLKNK